jgi:hypothetical protein
MAKSDGGAAFPVGVASSETTSAYINDGMSLRDWFAAHALAAGLHRDYPGENIARIPRRTWTAREAYGYADAMLSARNDDVDDDAHYSDA